MNLKGVRESTNYTDRTTAPWYDPNKILANVIIGMQRVVGSKKQAELDTVAREKAANPVPVQTPAQRQADFNAKVSRDPNGRGWTIQRQGQFDEFAPDYVDRDVISSILKQSGLAK